jgi:capsular exopolysaccharide synthesis family protein
MLKERNSMNSFAFTGCDSQVGNTTVCLNIAAELANAGKKTLLVDCDFLKPADEKRLYQFVDVGLAEFLQGSAQLENIIYDTDIPALSYISSGKHLINPTMMLWSDKFTDFVNKAAQVYEFVLFDAAPALAAPEVCVLAYRVSGTILTVQFGKSLKSQIYASKKELEKIGSQFLGVIVNKATEDECRIYQKTHGFSMTLTGPPGPPDIRKTDD